MLRTYDDWKATEPDLDPEDLFPCARCDNTMPDREWVSGGRCDHCGALLCAEERAAEEDAFGEERRDALEESWIRGMNRRAQQ